MNRYIILQSIYPFKVWNEEKFLTGGKIFFSFKEAHDVRKKILAMCNSIKYKVKKISEDI